jgi:hypothetical protein
LGPLRSAGNRWCFIAPGQRTSSVAGFVQNTIQGVARPATLSACVWRQVAPVIAPQASARGERWTRASLTRPFVRSFLLSFSSADRCERRTDVPAILACASLQLTARLAVGGTIARARFAAGVILSHERTTRSHAAGAEVSAAIDCKVNRVSTPDRFLQPPDANKVIGNFVRNSSLQEFQDPRHRAACGIHCYSWHPSRSSRIRPRLLSASHNPRN